MIPRVVVTMIAMPGRVVKYARTSCSHAEMERNQDSTQGRGKDIRRELGNCTV